MRVLKFGGTSVANAANIKQVADIIYQISKQEPYLIVVVSALGGITDELISVIDTAKKNEDYTAIIERIKNRHIDTLRELGIKKGAPIEYIYSHIAEIQAIADMVKQEKNYTPIQKDTILSFGERCSAYIIAQYIEKEKRKCSFFDMRKLIKTDSSFGQAKVDFEQSNANIRKYFDKHAFLHITTGFIGSNHLNQTTTLGRGGSDYTAAIIGAALNAQVVEIWTDVDGMLTADPRKVDNVFPLQNVTYEEAMEMSHFGAKVIYPPTLAPVFKKNIPIRIKNTFNPSAQGTLISHKAQQTKNTVKGISSIDDITLIKLQGSGMIGVAGIAGRLFGSLAKEQINVIIITQASSEHSICFAVAPKNAKQTQKTLRKTFAQEILLGLVDDILVEYNMSIVAVVGENMRKSSGVSGQLFESLGRNGINIVAIAQGSSELNLSLVINKKDLKKTLNVVHEAFFLSEINTINLFMIGVGLIGNTLIEQIKQHQTHLQKQHKLKLRFIGLANSKQMFFDEKGICLEHWPKHITEQGETMNIEAFVRKMIGLNMRNAIFIDSTASSKIIEYYQPILSNSISITTPNKIANSVDFATYVNLKETAKKHHVKYLYETNVGAGLPVISTLKDLLHSGDTILSIEGVLSGTLSYIFNSFDGSKPFSEVVKEAKEKGFTEPDPRNDLNGKDVARKILILARETGMNIEPESLRIESLVSLKGEKAKTIDEFMTVLVFEDQKFEQQLKEAQSQEKTLRYTASMSKEGIKIGLQSVDKNHPFYSLTGADNIISFTTQRYKERPLVIKGPGAGAEVTAAGVFAEIIKIGYYLSGR